MKLAVLGTRGIPAHYGGFETFAEELSKRMVARGHQVTVYCRQRHLDESYEGIRLRYIPTIRHKYLDTIIHTFLSTLHLITHPKEVALYCNAANAIFTLLPRLAGDTRGVKCRRIRKETQEMESFGPRHGTCSRNGSRRFFLTRSSRMRSGLSVTTMSAMARKPCSYPTERKRARSLPPMLCVN